MKEGGRQEDRAMRYLCGIHHPSNCLATYSRPVNGRIAQYQGETQDSESTTAANLKILLQENHFVRLGVSVEPKPQQVSPRGNIITIPDHHM